MTVVCKGFLANCCLLLAALHEAFSDGVTIDVSAACRPLVDASLNSNLSQHCDGASSACVCVCVCVCVCR